MVYCSAGYEVKDACHHVACRLLTDTKPTTPPSDAVKLLCPIRKEREK